jgi:hypothetical protein
MTDIPADTYPHDLMGPAARPPTNPRESVVAMAKVAQARELAAALEETLGAPAGSSADYLAALPPWRVAGAIAQLFTEANAANPRRDKSSDGTIVGPGHTTNSDHYPWVKDPSGKGVVRAGDVDVDGLDMAAAVERARQLAAAGMLPQLVDGGYIIFNGRITAPDFAEWHRYKGPNPHVTHGHFSVSRQLAQFDDRRPWGIFTDAPAPAPQPGPAPPPSQGWTGPDLTGRGRSLRGDRGNNGPRVGQVQAFLRDVFPLYAKHLAVDGWWGDQTTGVLREFAHRSGIPSADGLNIGPKIAAALHSSGFDRTSGQARALRHLARQR